jgi:hypothetical protein
MARLRRKIRRLMFQHEKNNSLIEPSTWIRGHDTGR